jgi:hypothetical protein
MPDNDNNTTSTTTLATTITDPPVDDGGEQEVKDPAHVLELNDKYRRENKSLRDRLKASEEALDGERKKSMSEQERAIEEAKQAVREEVESEFRSKLLAAAVNGRAAALLADPDDAWRLIDFEDIDPEDTKAIDAEIKELLKAKPYLAKAALPEHQSIDQGPQGELPANKDANNWLRSNLGPR